MNKLRKILSKLENSLGYYSLIEIHGDNSILISGCKSIIEYESARMKIDTVNGIIEINGQNLCLSVFSGDNMSVTGVITSVVFGGRNA